MEVSVIVPNYNYSRYLNLRIDSILNQTFQDFEIILLDDCSTDDSASVLRSYANNPKVSVVDINTHNSGSPFLQWQKGLDYARGKYVWIAESDDWAEPAFLEKAVSALDSDPKVVLCQVGANIVDSEGNVFASWDKWRESSLGMTKFFSGVAFVNDYLKWSNVLYNASGIVFRKDAVGDAINKVSNFRVCGDWVFWKLLVEKGNVAVVCEKLNNFRRHNVSTATKASPTFEDFDCYMSFYNSGYYASRHDRIVLAGLLLTQADRRTPVAFKNECRQKVEDFFGLSSQWPVWYNLFLRILNKLSPWCMFPPNRIM